MRAAAVPSITASPISSPSFSTACRNPPADMRARPLQATSAAVSSSAFRKIHLEATVTLAYGYVKAKIVSEPKLKSSRHKHEIQYHLHFSMLVDGDKWDVAVNVGTNDDDDLLKYKIVLDFRHPIIETLGAAKAGAQDLTGQTALPALDFLRSDL